MFFKSEKVARITFNPLSVIPVVFLGNNNWYQSKLLKYKECKDHNKQQDEQEGCWS